MLKFTMLELAYMRGQMDAQIIADRKRAEGYTLDDHNQWVREMIAAPFPARAARARVSSAY